MSKVISSGEKREHGLFNQFEHTEKGESLVQRENDIFDVWKKLGKNTKVVTTGDMKMRGESEIKVSE